MRRLMLLRHAKTERAQPGVRDRDRKLMKRGRADAPIVGAYLAHHGLAPDLALVSAAERAAFRFSRKERFASAHRVGKASAEWRDEGGILPPPMAVHDLYTVGL